MADVEVDADVVVSSTGGGDDGSNCITDCSVTLSTCSSFGCGAVSGISGGEMESWVIVSLTNEALGAIDADESTSVPLLVMLPLVRLLAGNRVRMSRGVDGSLTSFSDDFGLN